MKNQNTVVIIPVYNEEKVIRSVIEKVEKYFSNIVCVDDGSIDKSSEEIKKTSAILVEHAINLGAGAATQTGIDYALQNSKTKYFVTLDADGQHDANDANRMLQYLKEYKTDIVLGSRFTGSVQNISSLKQFFLKVAEIFSTKTTGVKLTDPHIGLRVFNRRFAENLKLTLPDFTHASELVNRIAEGKYKYAEVPVTVIYSDYSKSKGQPMLNAVNIAFDLFFHRISKK